MEFHGNDRYMFTVKNILRNPHMKNGVVNSCFSYENKKCNLRETRSTLRADEFLKETRNNKYLHDNKITAHKF